MRTPAACDEEALRDKEGEIQRAAAGVGSHTREMTKDEL